MRTIHIADDFDDEMPINVIVAYCGRVGLIMPDASLHPDDFDFVLQSGADQCTCDPCLVALIKQQALHDLNALSRLYERRKV